MKIATAAYPLDALTSWAQYEDKLADWIETATARGAELLVFPEYGAMELAYLDEPNIAGDLERSLHAVSDRLPDADALHSRLARAHNVHILAASAPSFHPLHGPNGRPVNRARLFAPNGAVGVQDKQIMTRFEADIWDVAPGENLSLFNTALGRIGVLICYDAEFPLLGRALADADVILVPSMTETHAGFSRVRIGAQARALENQCVTVMSSVVGAAHWSEALGNFDGAGAVFGPPDSGFPATGVLAAGAQNAPDWTYAEVSREAIAHVRADGEVLGRRDWAAQQGRTLAQAVDLVAQPAAAV